jgi:uncharacterized membrane protein
MVKRMLFFLNLFLFWGAIIGVIYFLYHVISKRTNKRVVMEIFLAILFVAVALMSWQTSHVRAGMGLVMAVASAFDAYRFAHTEK